MVADSPPLTRATQTAKFQSELHTACLLQPQTSVGTRERASVLASSASDVTQPQRQHAVGVQVSVQPTIHHSVHG